jgi:hypothetical protein
MFESLPAADMGRFFALMGMQTPTAPTSATRPAPRSSPCALFPAANRHQRLTCVGRRLVRHRLAIRRRRRHSSHGLAGERRGADSCSYSTGTYAETISIGSLTSADVFTIRIDDLATSASASNYPLPDLKVFGLRPNGMGTNVNAAYFQHEDGSAAGSTTWQRLDDLPLPTANSDYVKQVTASGTSYLELTFEDTAETLHPGRHRQGGCQWVGQPDEHAKTNVFDGSAERVVHSGLHGGTNPLYRRLTISPATSPWTQAALNGLKFRIGHGSDVNPVPYWQAPLGVRGRDGRRRRRRGWHPRATSRPRRRPPCLPPLPCPAMRCRPRGRAATPRPPSPPTLHTVINLGGSGAGDC